MWLLLVIASIGTLWPSDDWTSLDVLRPGDRISVQRRDGTRVEGVFARVTAGAVSFASGVSETGVARDDVRSVTLLSRNKRLRNAAIGALAGLTAGLVTYNTFGTYLRNEGREEPSHHLMWAVPLAAGAAIGASRAGHPVIYRARRQRPPVKSGNS